MKTQPEALDPFHHLHDEAYLQRFEAPVISADTLVILADRETQSLDGPWQFTLDMFDEGLRQKWFELDDAPAKDWTHPRDYHPIDGDSLKTPSNWSMVNLSGVTLKAPAGTRVGLNTRPTCSVLSHCCESVRPITRPGCSSMAGL